jgi:hypothetical protein
MQEAIVDVEDQYGTVEDITLRHTVVRTWEHKRLITITKSPPARPESATFITWEKPGK